MKRTFRLITTCIFLVFSIAAFCQKKPLDTILSNKPIAVLDCSTPLVNNACNQIFNNNLTPTWAGCFASTPLDPFRYCFADWSYYYGDPQINLKLPLIGPTINHASMWAYYYTYPGSPSVPNGEAIGTRVSNLIPGHKYAMSFYRRTWRNSPNTTYPYLDQVNITLMKCNDFVPFSGAVPDPPANSQTIYCETNVNKPNWERAAQTFTANDNYDIVWIYPKQLSTTQWWLEFGKMELIDVTNFSAGPSPNPVYPNNCTVTIGPATPNTCALTGAVYTWYGPNGQVIAAPANQQIQVNAANTANAGTWVLKMTVPGTTTTNNTCSNALDVQASVNVPLCSPCAPVITPGGPIDYYVPTDCSTNGVTLSSNKATGNQWYHNNVAITGATAQTYIAGEYGVSTITAPGNFYVVNNGCQSNTVTINVRRYGYGTFGEEPFYFGSKSHPVQSSNYFCHNTAGNLISQFNLGPGAVYSWKFPVRSNAFGTSNTAIMTPTPGSYNPTSNQMQMDISAPTYNSYTYLQGIADLNGRQVILDYLHVISPNGFINPNQTVCATAGQNIINFEWNVDQKLPGNSGFDWETYNFGANGLIISGPGTGQNNITIAGRSAAQPMRVRFSGPSTVTKNFYYNWGGCYKEQYNVTLNNNCRTAGEQIFATTIYPNPTTSAVTITASDAKLQLVEIADFANFTVKRVKLQGQKSVSINLADLKPGIYNCRITTEKGTENQKLMIKR
jgi:Secretion system C-terminal sorting domain